MKCAAKRRCWTEMIWYFTPENREKVALLLPTMSFSRIGSFFKKLTILVRWGQLHSCGIEISEGAGILNKIFWSHPLLTTLVTTWSWSWSLLELKECLLSSQLAGHNGKRRTWANILQRPTINTYQEPERLLKSKKPPRYLLVGALASWTQPWWKTSMAERLEDPPRQRSTCLLPTPSTARRGKTQERPWESWPAPAEPLECSYREYQEIQKSYSKWRVWKHRDWCLNWHAAGQNGTENDTGTESNKM